MTPQPVEFRHWEFYLATQHSVTHEAASGTAPHIEVNYGALPGLQLHVIAPLAYAHSSDGLTFYGLGNMCAGLHQVLRKRNRLGLDGIQ